MTGTRVFAGVVTHPRSRFNTERAAERRLSDLARDLTDCGVAVETLVSDRNDFDPEVVPIDRRMLLASARYQAGLEYRWRRYLTGAGAEGRSHAADVVMRAAMTTKRMLTAVAGSPNQDPELSSGGRAVIRLLNIDLSHLRVLEAGVARGCDWILVLEDDAAARDEGVAASLAWLLDVVADSAVDFVNLSESIDTATLGVRGLLAESDEFPVPPDLGFRVLDARVPLTNTVCATLYRASYAADLASCIRRRGLVPVAPIDWRVNACLMDFVGSGRLNAASCLWVEPGLFVQRSMHGRADEEQSVTD